MNIESYLNLYKDKPILDKIIAYGETTARIERADFKSSTDVTKNPDDRMYYLSEYHAQIERANGLLDMIKREIATPPGF